MVTINTSDIIFATLFQHGRQVVTLRLSGLSSFSDIIRQVRRASAGCIGLVTLHLRNCTQGWSGNRPIMMRGCDVAPVQLSLF